MKKTQYNQLGLWEGTDFPNIMIPNNNMEKIDNRLHFLDTQGQSVMAVANSALNKVVELGSDLTAQKSRITENAEAIETLDDTASRLELATEENKELIENLKGQLTDFIGGTGKHYKIKEVYNFQRALNCTVTNTSNVPIPELNVEYESTGRVTTTLVGSSEGVPVLMGFDVNGSINISDVVGEIDPQKEAVIVVSTTIGRSSVSTGTRHLIPKFYGKETSGSNTVLHFNEHKKFIGKMTRDSSNTAIYSIGTGEFSTAFEVNVFAVKISLVD